MGKPFFLHKKQQQIKKIEVGFVSMEKTALKTSYIVCILHAYVMEESHLKKE